MKKEILGFTESLNLVCGKVKKVTLDNNVIIDLENKDSSESYATLLKLHGERKIRLRIPAISASEKKPDGPYSNFGEFEKRISALGLVDAEILSPIAYFGMGYFGHCIFGGGDLSELEEKIQKILFPNTEMSFAQYCKNRGPSQNDEMSWKKWVNVKCDVLSLWCHIYYKGDIFVTTDKNFHKKTKKPLLIKLGAGEILRPDEAIGKLC